MAEARAVRALQEAGDGVNGHSWLQVGIAVVPPIAWAIVLLTKTARHAVVAWFAAFAVTVVAVAALIYISS
jgi:hypothetical protein